MTAAISGGSANPGTLHSGVENAGRSNAGSDGPFAVCSSCGMAARAAPRPQRSADPMALGSGETGEMRLRTHFGPPRGCKLHSSESALPSGGLGPNRRTPSERQTSTRSWTLLAAARPSPAPHDPFTPECQIPGSPAAPQILARGTASGHSPAVVNCKRALAACAAPAGIFHTRVQRVRIRISGRNGRAQCTPTSRTEHH